jgi:hypothetical protein
VKNAYSSVAKPLSRKLLGKTMRRWEDNTKTGLRELEREGMDWIGVAQDTVK